MGPNSISKLKKLVLNIFINSFEGPVRTSYLFIGIYWQNMVEIENKSVFIIV